MVALWSLEIIILFLFYHDLEPVSRNKNKDSKKDDNVAMLELPANEANEDSSLCSNPKTKTFWIFVKNGKKNMI